MDLQIGPIENSCFISFHLNIEQSDLLEMGARCSLLNETLAGCLLVTVSMKKGEKLKLLKSTSYFR